MLTDAETPGSDDWWLIRCASEMGQGFPRLFTLKRHRDGDALIPEEATPAIREVYLANAKRSRLVMSDLIVNAKTTRQRVLGARTAAVGDDLGDETAFAHWKRSNMQVQSRKLLADMGHYGCAYIVVTGSTLGTGPQFEGKKDAPLMTVRNGWSTYAIQYDLTPWLSEAAITIGYDPVLGADTIVLWRPGYVRTAVAPVTDQTRIPNDGSIWAPGATDWTWTGPARSLGYTSDCAVVKIETLDGFGVYEKHLDTVDRINETIKQRSTIIAMQAFRQRAIEGDFPSVYPADHELAGQTIDYDELFKAGPASLWFIPGGAKVWESAVTDITPVLTANDKDIKHLAAVTSTPLYVLSPDAAAGSAAGAELSERMLKFTVMELNDIAAGGFAVALGLCFQADRDDVRADPSTIEIIFASISEESWGARASASAQAKAGGMSQQMINEKIFGLTPAEMRQEVQNRQNEAFDTPTVVSGVQQATITASQTAETAAQQADATALSGAAADADADVLV